MKAKGDRDHLGPDERVAVLISADPGAELENPSERRGIFRVLAR
jgi:hypothetical protein